jgi:hypothetical protein
MSEFASCYFCGTALDAQIEPYPVIPEDAGTDDRPTVDLCPVCRRKLSKVLDVALSAADDAEVAATPLAAGPDPSPLEADHEDPTAGLGSEDEEPAYAVEPSGEATAVEDTAAAEDDGDADDEGDVDSADGDGGEADAVSGTDQAEDGAAVTNAEAPETENESADGRSDDDSASAESAAETAEADDAVANGEEPGRATDDGGEAEEPGANDHTEVDDGETAESESDKPAILSTPAAQKIIKLLQNRDFPVERGEIEVVASNAYEIPQQDCDDVIEALVSEGYVGERKGELVRPEE